MTWAITHNNALCVIACVPAFTEVSTTDTCSRPCDRLMVTPYVPSASGTTTNKWLTGAWGLAHESRWIVCICGTCTAHGTCACVCVRMWVWYWVMLVQVQVLMQLAFCLHSRFYPNNRFVVPPLDAPTLNLPTVTKWPTTGRGCGPGTPNCLK